MNRFEEAVKADKVLAGMSPKSVEYASGREIIVDIMADINHAYDSVQGERTPEKIPVGLLYGRIQSGKTRNMVLTAAKALDGRFKVIIVLTTDNNDLVQQTYNDFKNGLPGVKVISKAELVGEADSEAALLKAVLPTDGGAVVIVCSKGSTVLEKVIEFLGDIDAQDFPTLIFDDEGDQASIDTTVRSRSRGNEAQPSRIFSLIHSSEFASLRNAVSNSIFVSVTGTPQAIFLQNSDSDSRPSFVKLIEPGRGYVGGDVFFSNLNPESNKYVQIVDEDEAEVLLNRDEGIPEGLRASIEFFVVSATIAGLTGTWRGFNMLVHPSLNRFDHKLVRTKMTDYVNKLFTILIDETNIDYQPTITRFKEIYREVVGRKTVKGTPTFDDVVAAIKATLPQRQVFVINSDRRGQTQSPSLSYNFLIGGNSIGRGIAVKNLLVTYYTRSPKTAQMDTMHQHARMFGYRYDDLRYTQLFLPTTLYTRFFGIHKSDTDIRAYIDAHDDINSVLVPVYRSLGLQPTRSNVIHYHDVDIILPGSQLYPDKPIFERPKATTIRNKVDSILNRAVPDYQKSNTLKDSGIVIDTEVAVEIAAQIKTHRSGTWRDDHIQDNLKFLGGKYDNKVLLRYREAPRRANRRGDGSLPAGVISGADQAEARLLDMPTLWIFLVRGSKAELNWDGVDFFYPTLILPNSPDSLFANVS